MLTPLSALACEDWVAKVVAVEGAVQHKHGQQDWQPLQRDQHICPGASVKVGDNSRASLHLRNNTFTRLDAASLLSFPVQTRERRFWVELRQGLAHFISRIVHEFEVSTPYVNAVVEGTEFVVAAQQGQGAVSVMEGKVTAYNEKSRANLTAGQQAASGGRDQDLSRFNVPADTLVEWAIHYPPVLSLAELPTQTAQDRAALQQAIAALQQNRVDQALQILEDAPASDLVQLARGTLLLQIGRMPEFTRTIEPLLQGPTSGLAHGLKSIAAIARNDIASGRASADIAVQRAPNSAATWIALSYAQQAELQLNAALESARKATQVQPTSLLAHLRLSELHLAQGDVDAARDALEAVPDDVARGAELEGSKGFVQLFRLKLDSAREHFNRALTMDSSNPQYQLGLGLTLLRDGDLKAGRQHMEYAVSLDPLRSVLRSYLGRAYFEEKRDDVALEQWQLAKQFDPNDPTPYFYTGVHKLFANDPIGAVEELETSRELNDKRAIYRSETLLQSDAASRSATLARAYGEVGYDQGVLLSGWDALRRDPTSSEGHRLLADYYAGDPRYETARVSELLQSQLWQPLSAYPLQPQLSEANLAVVAGAGPQRPGFNEYHSLFTQDGAYGMVNGYAGSDNTWGNDLVGSVLAGPVALSLGQYHYESDGWRENADQEQDIYNGLVQWQVGPSTSVQYEHRDLKWDQGFLAPTIGLSEDMSTSEESQRTTDRIGIVHHLSPATSMVLSVASQSWIFDADSTQEIGDTVEGFEKDGIATEFQLVSNEKYYSIVIGGGYFRSDSKDGLAQSIGDDLGGFFYEVTIDRESEVKTKLYTGYADFLYKGNDWLDVSFGLNFFKSKNESSASELQSEFLDGFELGSIMEFYDDYAKNREEWLPSIGVQVRPWNHFKFRAAYFETLFVQSIMRQSIAPTNFIGFNKVFNEFDGVEAKNYALALDFAGENIDYGMLAMFRRLRVPNEGLESTTYLKQSESIVDLYFRTQLLRLLSFGSAFEWARKEARDESALLLFSLNRVDQYKVPFNFTIFYDHGLSMSLEQAYYVQDASTVDNNNFDRKSSWITDIWCRYKFPARNGDVLLGVKNLLGEDEEFLSFSERELAFYPGRFFYASISFNL